MWAPRLIQEKLQQITNEKHNRFEFEACFFIIFIWAITSEFFLFCVFLGVFCLPMGVSFTLTGYNNSWEDKIDL